MTDYEPTLDHDSIHPAQWTHFKSKKDKKEESKHQSSKDKQAAFRTENETIFGAAPDPKKVSAPTSHHPRHTVTHPTATHHPEHPPLVIGSPRKKRRWPRLKFTKNAPLLIVLASLGIILIAMGAYMFKDTVSNNFEKKDLPQLATTEKLSFDASQLEGMALVSTNDGLQMMNPASGQITEIDPIFKKIPNRVKNVKVSFDARYWLILTHDNGLYLVDTLKHQLTDLALLIGSDQNIELHSATWSADSHHFVMIGSDAANDRSTQQNIFSVDASIPQILQKGSFSADQVNVYHYDHELETITGEISTGNETVVETRNISSQKVINKFPNALLSTTGYPSNYLASYNNQGSVSFIQISKESEPEIPAIQINSGMKLNPIIHWSSKNSSFILSSWLPTDRNIQQLKVYSLNGETIFQTEVPSSSKIFISQNGNTILVSHTVQEDGQPNVWQVIKPHLSQKHEISPSQDAELLGIL